VIVAGNRISKRRESFFDTLKGTVYLDLRPSPGTVNIGLDVCLRASTLLEGSKNFNLLSAHSKQAADPKLFLSFLPRRRQIPSHGF
jgi:hypothetical protein